VRVAAWLLAAVVIAAEATCVAQDSPVLKVHAYEMPIVGGPPGRGPSGPAGRTRRVIYLEVAPASDVAIEGVWMGDALHAVDTTIRKAPVRLESAVNTAPDARNIAVPATTNKVVEIVVGDALPDRKPGSDALAALRGNRAAIQATSGGRALVVPVAGFETRDPIYLP